MDGFVRCADRKLGVLRKGRMTVEDLSAKAHAFQLRIAIVDDDPFLRRGLTRLFRRHDVVDFEYARDLLDRVRAGERFDVILSDLMMPVLTGADLHWALEQVAPEQATRMIVLTGGATTDEAQDFLMSEAVPVLRKPFEPAEVVSLVERVGQRSRASGFVGRTEPSG